MLNTAIFDSVCDVFDTQCIYPPVKPHWTQEDSFAGTLNAPAHVWVDRKMSLSPTGIPKWIKSVREKGCPFDNNQRLVLGDVRLKHSSGVVLRLGHRRWGCGWHDCPTYGLDRASLKMGHASFGHLIEGMMINSLGIFHPQPR